MNFQHIHLGISLRPTTDVRNPGDVDRTMPCAFQVPKPQRRRRRPLPRRLVLPLPPSASPTNSHVSVAHGHCIMIVLHVFPAQKNEPDLQGLHNHKRELMCWLLDFQVYPCPKFTQYVCARSVDRNRTRLYLFYVKGWGMLEQRSCTFVF